MSRIAILSPLLILLLGGMSCAPDPVKLAAIPPPATVVIHEPTYVALPADATDPCPEPQARTIATDVDLLRAADAFKVAMRCNANKLKAIQGAQP